MAKEIGLEELLEERDKLVTTITKAVEQDLKKFYDKTGVAVKNVVISVYEADNSVSYVSCELCL